MRCVFYRLKDYVFIIIAGSKPGARCHFAEGTLQIEVDAAAFQGVKTTLSGRHSEKIHRGGDVFIQQNKSSSSFQPFHTPSLVSIHFQG